MRSDPRVVTPRHVRTPKSLGALAVGAIAYAVLLAPATLSVGLPAAVTVSDAWIRWLPANLPAAGYATLRNVGDQPATLIGVSTPDYGVVMFHESRNQHDIEQMMPIERIQIKAHTQLSFAPQSYHIMLMQPTRRDILPGDRVSLTLHFADGQALKAQFEVRSLDASAVKRTAGFNGGM
jgi:periplasmic copper chaperone A